GLAGGEAAGGAGALARAEAPAEGHRQLVVPRLPRAVGGDVDAVGAWLGDVVLDAAPREVALEVVVLEGLSARGLEDEVGVERVRAEVEAEAPAGEPLEGVGGGELDPAEKGVATLQ